PLAPLDSPASVCLGRSRGTRRDCADLELTTLAERGTRKRSSAELRVQKSFFRHRMRASANTHSVTKRLRATDPAEDAPQHARTDQSFEHSCSHRSFLQCCRIEIFCLRSIFWRDIKVHDSNRAG